jgi:hypothetical protein
MQHRLSRQAGVGLIAWSIQFGLARAETHLPDVTEIDLTGFTAVCRSYETAMAAAYDTALTGIYQQALTGAAPVVGSPIVTYSEPQPVDADPSSITRWTICLKLESQPATPLAPPFLIKALAVVKAAQATCDNTDSGREACKTAIVTYVTSHHLRVLGTLRQRDLPDNRAEFSIPIDRH